MRAEAGGRSGRPWVSGGATDQTHLGSDYITSPSEPNDTRGASGMYGKCLWAMPCAAAAQLRRSRGGSACCLTRCLSQQPQLPTKPTGRRAVVRGHRTSQTVVACDW